MSAMVMGDDACDDCGRPDGAAHREGCPRGPTAAPRPTVRPPGCALCGRPLVACDEGAALCEWCRDRADSALRVDVAMERWVDLHAAIGRLTDAERREYIQRISRMIADAGGEVPGG